MSFDPTAKVIGLLTAPVIGGVDYQLTKVTIKLEMEKVEYVPMGQGGWKYQIPGGAKVVTGSFEGGFDSTLNTSSNSGAGIEPFTNAATTIAVTIGGHAISFTAVVYDVEIDKSSTGLVTIKGSYESSGPISVS